MFTFFKHVGVGIISAFTAFTGAFHSQPAQIQVTQTYSNSTTTAQVTTDTTAPKTNKTTIKATATNPVSVVPTPTPVVSVNKVPVTNYSSYEILPSDFPKNPPYYIGTRIKIIGKIVDFMAAGDRGGTSNYIEIFPNNYHPVATPYIALKIQPTDYRTAVQNLNTGDTVTAYGVISTSQNFIDTTDALSTLIPVVEITRLDKCNNYPCSVNPGAWTVFPYFATPASNIVSIDTIGRNLDLYLNTTLTTEGSVAKIFDPASDGNTLLFIQDANMNKLAFVVSSSWIINNQIKIGNTLQVKGTLISHVNPEPAGVYQNYQLIITSAPNYMSNATVTLIPSL